MTTATRVVVDVFDPLGAMVIMTEVINKEKTIRCRDNKTDEGLRRGAKTREYR